MPWTGWPELWGLAAYLQGTDSLAKQSTRYLATGASITACDTDRSQYLTDLSVGTNVVYEAATTRFNRSAPRTIGVNCTANSTDTGVLYQHGTGGNLERLQFSAANTIQVTVNNATALTYTVTGLDGTRDELVIAWISEANPDTTGAGDAVQSWLLIWNVANSTFDRTRFAHAVKALESTTAYWGASSTIGASAFTGTITGIWFENRLQSATEISADWISSLPAISTDSETEHEHQGLPVSADMLDLPAGGFHGPSAQWAVDATRRMVRRTLSPLVNHRFRVRHDWSDLDMASDPFVRGAPGDNSYRLILSTLFAAPIPDTCSHAWVRVHMRSFSHASAVPIGVRVYSLSKPLGAIGIAAPGAVEPLVYYSTGETVTRDDTGDGEWTVLGHVTIARGTGSRDGMSYFAVALNVDPAGVSADDAAARVIVQALHIVPDIRLGGPPFGGGGGFGL